MKPYWHLCFDILCQAELIILFLSLYSTRCSLFLKEMELITHLDLRMVLLSKLVWEYHVPHNLTSIQQGCARCLPDLTVCRCLASYLAHNSCTPI